MKYPDYIEKLILFLRKLPGVGRKTAERFAFQLITWNEKDLMGLSTILQEVKHKIKYCETCGALVVEDTTCKFCNENFRDKKTLCIVSSHKDIFYIEATRTFNGMYHVVPDMLSPLDGVGPEEIGVCVLKKRVEELSPQEIIIALDSTIEGDATSLYIRRELEHLDVVITRLALGIPVGSTLEYVDENTLGRSLVARLPM